VKLRLNVLRPNAPTVSNRIRQQASRRLVFTCHFTWSLLCTRSDAQLAAQSAPAIAQGPNPPSISNPTAANQDVLGTSVRPYRSHMAAHTPAARSHRRAPSANEVATEPPHKKRKYIPGGPGGGGRYIDPDGKEETPAITARAARIAPAPRRQPSVEAGETPTVTRSAMQTRPRRERPERYAPQPTTPRPRYSSSAAAAAAASQASDGYKPREERSWEDFHPDLEIDLALPIYTADEVDGRTNKPHPKLLQRSNSGPTESKPLLNGDADMKDAADSAPEPQEVVITPIKRKPGRPPRRPESMLHGLGSPPAPRIMPLPTHNPKERLNLPKPSFRQYNHFLQYEENQQENKKNYVDRTMASVGYQESDRFDLPAKTLVRLNDSWLADDEAEVGLRLESDGAVENANPANVVGKVEYDMDEQDVAWLEGINEQRRTEGVDAIKPAIFEITMTQIEKEYHALEKRIPKPQPRNPQMHRPRSSSQAAVNGDPNPPGDEPDTKCAICDDGDCENANAIIFCDGCDLAVHQECYGVPFIPEGQWFCRKCKEIGRGCPTCIFCPNVEGAFKQTNTLRWSHVLCAIWIPEVTIANMTFMEPITDVDKVPKGRWKLNCYICNQRMGACVQCGNKNCFTAFHVTCARKGKLFLKMKSQHQQGIDTTALKAFCDKHVPPEWRRVHDTDTAIVEAKRWYRRAMKDRRWADNQTAALELGAPPPPDGGLTGEDDTIAVTKRRKQQPPKMTWRLPSGAPVVPSIVFAAVEASLTRFTVRKRKEFVERVCRYWTLKREARRGAALLKRLQVQSESFSTMEITRRNFAGMGAVGRQKLEKRIDLGTVLQVDMGHVVRLANLLKNKAEMQLEDVLLLKDLVDTLYFPIPRLLTPILEKARK
jgi:NuA3 HAT complex component NTO1